MPGIEVLMIKVPMRIVQAFHVESVIGSTVPGNRPGPVRRSADRNTVMCVYNENGQKLAMGAVAFHS